GGPWSLRPRRPGRRIWPGGPENGKAGTVPAQKGRALEVTRMLRYLTAGESHGPGLTAIVDGIPAGLKLAAEDVDRDLRRRQGGYGRGGRMKIEKDQVRFLSGVRLGQTLGGPITLFVENRDFQHWQHLMAPDGDGDVVDDGWGPRP